MKTPHKELTPLRKNLALLGPVIGTGVPTYAALFMDSAPTFGVAAVGLGVGWAALRPVSDDAIVEWRPDLGRPAVVQGFLKWGAVAAAVVAVAIEVATRLS